MRLLPAFVTDAFRGIQAGREMRSGNSNLAFPSRELMEALLGGPTKSGASVNEHTAFNVSAVRACVNLRANMLAMLPLKVFKKTSLGSEEQRDHPLAKLFRGRVSGAQTRFKWVHSTQLCFDIGGNGYARVLRNSFSEISGLLYTRPIDVTPLVNKGTLETGFRVAGIPGDLRQWEVLHIPNLSSNGITGRSPIQDLREAVGLALTAEEFSARTFANGNRKPGIIQGKEGMTAAKAQDFLAFWMKNYAGAGNAGKSPMIWGAEWKEAGFTNDEAELLGQRKFTIEEIARVYHLPLHLIGSTEKSTTWGSGIAEMNQALVDYTLQPLCTNWEDEMKTTLLSEREQEEGYFIKFNVDALLRGSPADRAKFYQAMRAIRAMSVNEIRRLEDMMEAADTGANNLDWPLNNQGGGGQPDTQPAKSGTAVDPNAND